jgi:anthranilate/para-aminobenzoate synthase component I
MSKARSGDARQQAAVILKRLKQNCLQDSFCCYGTRDRVLIGIGRASSLELARTDTLDAVWSGINDYINENAGNYIFGFIGFDPANQLDKQVDDYRQKIDLFVPEVVIKCDAQRCTVERGIASAEILSATLKPANNTAAKTFPQTRETGPVDIHELDRKDLRDSYAESVAHFIEAIHAGTLERATLARKIDTDRNFDLSRTFLTDRSSHECARSFYFSNENVSFAGQCPELLAEGSTRSFTTNKLSGTYKRDNNVSISELSSRFRNDERIIAEHRSSIASIEASLKAIGTVESTKFQVMELPTLLHGWSNFITRPQDKTTIADCLRSIFPFGVNPVEQGLRLLAEHEDFCRGPYYGLVGCITADGIFSFTQVLRSAYTDNNSSYLMVGAAITSLSTPELEAEETHSKLFGVQVYKRPDARSGKSKIKYTDSRIK